MPRTYTDKQRLELSRTVTADFARFKALGLVRQAQPKPIAKVSTERIAELYCDTLAEFQEFATRNGLNFRGELIDMIQERMRRQGK